MHASRNRYKPFIRAERVCLPDFQYVATAHMFRFHVVHPLPAQVYKEKKRESKASPQGEGHKKVNRIQPSAPAC